MTSHGVTVTFLDWSNTLFDDASQSEPSRCLYNNTATTGITGPMQDPDNVVGLIGASVTIVLIIVGVLGNFQVLLLIIGCRRLHRSYYALIASLSFTDLLFNVCAMPFYADSYVYRTWRFTQVMCKVHTFFGAIILMTSGLHIGLIAFNRYVLIVHNDKYSRFSSRHAVCIQISSVWFISALTVLPGMLGWNAVVGYSDQVSRCNYLRRESEMTLTIIFSIGFFFPCAIMFACYVSIWWKVWSSKLRLTHGHKCMTSEIALHQDSRAAESINVSTEPLRDPRADDFIDTTSNPSVSVKSYTEPLDSSEQSHKERPESKDNSAQARRSTAVDDPVEINVEFLETALTNKQPPSFVYRLYHDRVPPRRHHHCELSASSLEDVNINGEEKEQGEAGLSDVIRNDADDKNKVFTTNLSGSIASGHDEIPGNTTNSLARQYRSNGLKSVRMILVVFLAYFFTYLPFIVINVGANNGHGLDRNWYMITSLAFWAGSGVNPIIYGIMNRQFRTAYVNAVIEVKRSLLSLMQRVR